MMLSGLKAYRWQHLSAYALALYFPACLLYLDRPIPDYATLLHTLSQPLFLIPSLAVIFLLLVHIWVGIRDIMMDYLPKKWLSPALTLFAAILLLLAADLLLLTITLITPSGATS